jgi:hypothetical protein
MLCTLHCSHSPLRAAIPTSGDAGLTAEAAAAAAAAAAGTAFANFR